MSDQRAGDAVRTTLRGKLFRSGRTWPLPIDDAARYRCWQVVDDLFVGDRIVLPPSDMRRILVLRVVQGTSGSFKNQIKCHSWDYYLRSHVQCQTCGVDGIFDVSIPEMDDDGAKFLRCCQCGGEQDQFEVDLSPSEGHLLL